MCFSSPKVPKPPPPILPPEPPKKVSEEDQLKKDSDKRRARMLRGIAGTQRSGSGGLTNSVQSKGKTLLGE